FAASMTDVLTPPSETPAPPPEPERRMTRRRLLGAGLSGAAVLAGAGFGVDRLIAGGGDHLPGPRSLPANGTPQRFHSRPDLEPTITSMTVRGPGGPGSFMVGPGNSPPVQAGTMIVDGR